MLPTLQRKPRVKTGSLARQVPVQQLQSHPDHCSNTLSKYLCSLLVSLEYPCKIMPQQPLSPRFNLSCVILFRFVFVQFSFSVDPILFAFQFLQFLRISGSFMAYCLVYQEAQVLQILFCYFKGLGGKRGKRGSYNCHLDPALFQFIFKERRGGSYIDDEI